MGYLAFFNFENGSCKQSLLNLAELQHGFMDSSQVISNIL